MSTNLGYAVPTGDFIEEWLENGMSQAELARNLGCTPKHVSKLIHGAPLTNEFALQLSSSNRHSGGTLDAARDVLPV